jgi:hypothetical protein
MDKNGYAYYKNLGILIIYREYDMSVISSRLSRSYRLIPIIMPVLAVASIAAAGSALLHASHAQDATSGSQTVLPAGKTLPTSVITACCRLNVVSMSDKNGTSRHVSLNVTVHNITNTTQELAPGLQFYLVDSAGNAHPYTAAYQAPGATIGGPLRPGATTTLPLDFEMAPSEIPSYLQFQLNAGSQQVTVGLPS